jgi:hypothetical protein
LADWSCASKDFGNRSVVDNPYYIYAEAGQRSEHERVSTGCVRFQQNSVALSYSLVSRRGDMKLCQPISQAMNSLGRLFAGEM